MVFQLESMRACQKAVVLDCLLAEWMAAGMVEKSVGVLVDLSVAWLVYAMGAKSVVAMVDD